MMKKVMKRPKVADTPHHDAVYPLESKREKQLVPFEVVSSHCLLNRGRSKKTLDEAAVQATK